MKVLRMLRMHPDQMTASEDTNRWHQVPASLINHLCLGSVFAWSIFNEPLTRALGVIVPASGDWALAHVGTTFSLIMGGFLWAGLFSPLATKWGPRAACTLGAISLGGGFALISSALYTHNIYLLYTGGLVWGMANGWAYVPPVATLLRWFPDRKGMASGLCILGFGGGAMIASPLFSQLLNYFRQTPEFVGSASSVELINKSGVLFAEVRGALREVVVATAEDARLYDAMEGVYLVGTGSTGAAETFLTLGVGYLAVMSLCARMYQSPHPNYKWGACETQAGAGKDKGAQLTLHNVSATTAAGLPQFWHMFAGFGLSITGVYAIISTGKTLLTEAFQTQYPEIVTASFATAFVAGLSASNMGGRLAWSAFSDFLARKLGGDPLKGRKLTFSIMWGLAAPSYIAISWAIQKAYEEGYEGVTPLVVFCGSVFVIMSSFGGTTAVRPALVGDMFGMKWVSQITSRQLAVVCPASLVGPQLAFYLRQRSINQASADLANKIPDSHFQQAFGSSKDTLPQLIESKTATINRLLELCPPGTIDPTPFVYNETMYVAAGLTALAFATNQMMRPINPKYHEAPSSPSSGASESQTAASGHGGSKTSNCPVK